MNEIFEKIAKITFEISKCYQRLVFLEINKNYNLNYEEEKIAIINKLKALKIIEDSLYEKLSKNPYYLIQTTKFILDNKLSSTVKDNLSADMVENLIRLRIENKIVNLASNNEIIDRTIIMKDKNNNVLISLPNDIANILERLYEDSFEFRIASLINQELENNDTDTYFIEKKYWQTFLNHKLENYYVDNGFTNVLNTFSKDIITPSEIDEKKQEEYFCYVSFTLLKSYLEELIEISPSKEATDLIMRFKVALLYLKPEYLKIIKDLINELKFKSFIIGQTLINVLNNFEQYKKLQDKDINKTLKLD